LEAQLQEAKQHADMLQAQIKTLTPVERMKRFIEQRTAQQQVHTLQSKVMEVAQQLQPIQERACQLFAKLEIQEANSNRLSSLQNNAWKDCSMTQ
jgi:gamma-glutamylcysteine synthetase